jgi:hypothetical protein
LVHESVEVRSIPTSAEISCEWHRISETVTNLGHRPKSHQAHLEWMPFRLVN